MAGILLPTITARVQRAFDTVLATDATVSVRSAEVATADLQTNDALRLGAKYPGGARALAAAVAAQVGEDEMHAPLTVSGPGYLNVRLRDEWLARHLLRVVSDDALGLEPPTRPRRVIVDYSSPNVAKRMHVGHLRSTILGDTLARVLRRVGHHVLGDNHVGDWGTQFGLLLWGWKALLGRTPEDLDGVDIDALEALYRDASTRAREDPEVAAAARRELVALQQGDPERLALWQVFVALSRREAERLYERLGVRHDLWLGESHYNPMLPDVVARLRASGHAEDSEGAVVVRFPEAELAATPFLIEKSDGGYLYATTDIATVIDRVERLEAEHVVYVVDVRQSLHFRQLFATARMLGYDTRLDHVGFGMMLGADGRPFRTRDGGTVTLEALLDEAEERTLPTVRERWPEASPKDLRSIAACVGVAAVKYADLSMSLGSDYRFDWDRMLSAEGDTGPYLLYGLVRLRSLLRRAADAGSAPADASQTVRFTTPVERRLAVTLARFGDALDQTAEQLRPHILCGYLHGLVKTFSAFYHDCPVLDAPTPEERACRLLLVRATERVLDAGLECLNLPRPERM